MRPPYAFLIYVLNFVCKILAYLFYPFFTRWELRGYKRGISQAVTLEVQRLKLGAERLYAFLSLKAVF